MKLGTTEKRLLKQLAISQQRSLPIDAATQTFAFLGRKGSGKTYGSGKLVELLLAAGTQVVILDTVGNWYGLRLAADGKGKGFELPVIGGLRGDIPLEETGGALVANTLVDTGRSAVLDVSQFSKAARQRFATAFGEQLWQRKKAEAHPAPLMLVIEECQLIIPQDVQADQRRMVGIYEEIVRLGRNYGVGAMMISQRPQSVNKEVLNQTECLFVFQTNGAHEREALKKWVVAQGAAVDLVQELPSLPVGTAYLWSPQWLQTFERIEIAKKVTYDASATPKVGDKRPAARNLTPLDLDDLKTQMQAVVERAKATDPKALQAQVAELQKQLTAAKSAPAPKPERVEVPVFSDKEHKTLEKLLGFAEQVATQLREALANKEPQVKMPVRMAPLPPPSRDLSKHVRLAPAEAARSSALGDGERKILIACAQRMNGAGREQLSILTGYKRSTRDAYIQRLRGRGYVREDNGQVHVTAEGVGALGRYEPLPTGAALLAHWLQRLPEGERAVLEVVVAPYPQAISREQISELTGYKRSTRDAYIQRLSVRRLVTASADGITASEELFG